MVSTQITNESIKNDETNEYIKKYNDINKTQKYNNSSSMKPYMTDGTLKKLPENVFKEYINILYDNRDTKIPTIKGLLNELLRKNNIKMDGSGFINTNDIILLLKEKYDKKKFLKKKGGKLIQL